MLKNREIAEFIKPILHRLMQDGLFLYDLA